MYKIFDRIKKEYIEEQVPSGFFLHFLYNSYYAKALILPLVVRKFVSKIAGWYYDTTFSKKEIKSFVNKYKIDLTSIVDDVDKYNCFNDFFSRKIKLPFDIENICNKTLYSPCDAKLRAYENIDVDNVIQFKGLTYSLKELLRDDNLTSQFIGGTMLIFRLAPTDYHRFHNIDNGELSTPNLINGKYYSVAIDAIKNIQDVYLKNKRYISMLESENFGKVINVDVAATCVGTVVYENNNNQVVTKFSERGHFKFGGSTIIMLFQKNKVKIDEDIIKITNEFDECVVKVGEKIGIKVEA